MSGTVMPSHGFTWNGDESVAYGCADGGRPCRWRPSTWNRYVPARVWVPRPVSMSESNASKCAVHFHSYEPVAYVTSPLGSGSWAVTTTSPDWSPAVTHAPFSRRWTVTTGSSV